MLRVAGAIHRVVITGHQAAGARAMVIIMVVVMAREMATADNNNRM